MFFFLYNLSKSAKQDTKYVYENKYDSHGNVTYSSKSKVLDDNSTQKEIEISSSYNAFENVERSTIKIENTDTLTYNYNYDNSPDNRLQSLTLPNSSKQKIEYDVLQRVKDIYYDDKFSKHINYVKKGEYCSDLISSVWYGKDGIIKDNTKYTYDEKGNITKIFENGTEKVKYTYDELSRLIREDNRELNKTFIYSYDNGLTDFNHNGTEYTYKKNIQNDIVGIYDNNGQEITKYIYDAWGNHKTFVLNDRQFVDISTQTSYTQSGLNNKTIALLNPFRYRSYYYDEETGLYYQGNMMHNWEDFKKFLKK